MSKASSSGADGARPAFVTGGTQRRVMGASDWWFYPLMLVAALGLIVLSLGLDAFDTRVTPQRAERQGATLSYGPHQLARGTRIDADQVRYVVRDFGVNARAVRFAVKPNRPAPTARDTGARLLLDPAETAALVGKPVRVEVQYVRLPRTAAGGMALSLQNGGPVIWASKPLPPESGVVTIDLPAVAGAAPTALGLRMLSDREDFNCGGEIQRITLKPLG